MSAQDLLQRIPDPDDDEIREALAGNLCRCTGYQKIIDAVHDGGSRHDRPLERRRAGRAARLLTRG